MARLNKFASVNLNDSYGKPDRGGSASSSNNGTPSGSGKPRISSPGGMLVLSRPGRNQPPSPKPGQARLGIPSPVNLPSLKRETSAGESLAASPPIAGWSKGESPPLQTGWTKAGESPTDMSPLHQKAALSRSLDTVGESLKAMSTGKPDVYAPPAMRAAAMQAGSASRAPPPTPPPLIEKPSAIIRGEEFPTLQAAVARPPTPPQHPRQKDLQLKQREKQQEAKEQQLKLQQLSQVQGHKQVQVDSFSSSNGNFQSQPPTLSLRPLGKPESTYQKVNVVEAGPDPSLPSQFGGLDSHAYPDGSLSWSRPAGVSAQTGANSKGSNGFRLPPTGGMPSPGNVSKGDDAKDSGHNFRPQYRSSLPASQSSSRFEVQQSGFQANSESSWLSSSRRDFVSAPRDINHMKYAGGICTNSSEETGRIDSEMRSASYAKESYFIKDASSYREGSSTSGIVRGDSFMEQGMFSKDSSDVRGFGRSSSLVHDSIPRIEGFHSQRSFVKEVYNREAREGNTRVHRESSTRDVGDSYSRDVRENRESFFRDSGDTYEQDVKEAYSRDYRNVYTRDVREVYSQDSAISKQMGYGYTSSNNGDNSWRGHSGHADPPYGRGVVSPAGISPSHNLGSVYDSHYGKQPGSSGIGDQFFSREARSGNDPKAPRSLHTEPNHSNNSEMLGSRRVRSPALNSSSFDPIKEVHEVHSDRSERLYEEDRQAKYEDKVMDVKGAGSELHGSSLVVQWPVTKRESAPGFGTRAVPTSINRNLDDERSTREDTKKQLAFEDERRKEAAKQKLMELEERIARRAAEARKEEVEEKGKEASVEPVGLKQQDVELIPSNAQYEPIGMAPVTDRDGDVAWGEEDSGPKSSVSSWTHKTPVERATYPEVESRLVGESELNQDRKMVRPRSPGSWRKEVGGGPTSKLFSSPYIESGGFRRPSDGGTYKLF